MTTSKPEIEIYEPSEKGVTAMRKASFRNTGPERYVRLSDYEAASASDKARIAELESALSECAASLAWNCFGECRAVHDGPIMSAQMALEHSRAALQADRDQQYDMKAKARDQRDAVTAKLSALQAKCEKLLARVEELEKTMAAIKAASGYRWMKGISDHKLLSDIEQMTKNVTQAAELDIAIDAAMQEDSQ